MKREEIAKELAKTAGLTDSEARDEVDELVQKILHRLRHGGQIQVPGVGKLVGTPHSNLKKAR